MLQLELVARQEIASTSLLHQPTERLLIGVLGDDPTHIDALQETTGLSSAEISAALAMLELKGEVRQVGGMNFVRTREGRIEYRVD
jgi:DNA processing protein